MLHVFIYLFISNNVCYFLLFTIDLITKIAEKVVMAQSGARATTEAAFLCALKKNSSYTVNNDFSQRIFSFQQSIESFWFTSGVISDDVFPEMGTAEKTITENGVVTYGTQHFVTEQLILLQQGNLHRRKKKSQMDFKVKAASSVQCLTVEVDANAYQNVSFRGRKPDIVYYEKGRCGELAIVLIGDVKPRDNPNKEFTESQIGHILDMSKELMLESQPYRNKLISFLTDGYRFQFFEICRGYDSNNLEYHFTSPYLGVHGWQVLMQLVRLPLYELGYIYYTFHDSNINLTNFLGRGKSSYVFGGTYENQKCLIKIYRNHVDFNNEKWALNLINHSSKLSADEKNFLCQHCPSVIAETVTTDRFRVLVVSPWADCVEPIPGGSRVDSQHITDLVRVLQIVHTKLKICHRDVKPWNIFIYDNNIILSDWGSARSSLSPVTWEGTLGFYEGYFGEEYPLPSNDLIALLKSAYLMLFNNCHMPVTEMETFWTGLIKSNRNTVWKLCHESCLNRNYDEFIHYIQPLK
jgi:hypothetical protein